MENYNTQQSQIQMQNPALYTMTTRMIKDMKFNAYFNIVYGALICITIIGAIIGIPMLIAGLRLRDASNAYKTYLNDGDISSIFKGFENQRTYFFIQKAFIIVGIIFFILYAVVIFGLVTSGNLGETLEGF